MVTVIVGFTQAIVLWLQLYVAFKYRDATTIKNIYRKIGSMYAANYNQKTK